MKKIHRTRCGKLIPLEELTDGHLANIINLWWYQKDKVQPYIDEYNRRITANRDPYWAELRELTKEQDEWLDNASEEELAQHYAEEQAECDSWLERGEDLLLDHDDMNERAALVSVIGKLL